MKVLSDYLVFIGVVLLFQPKFSIIGILCILVSFIFRRKKSIKDKKHIDFEQD